VWWLSLLFEDLSTVGGYVTAIDINGQGKSAFLKPDERLIISGKYVVQNPRDHPTRTVQLILFLEDKFLKCIYNDVPPAEPDAEEGTFSFKCYPPELPSRYAIRAGWAYNWPWPEDAYKYLLAYPQKIETVGEFSVGVFVEKPISPLSALPYVLPVVGVVMVLGGRRK
jgi:hypothetical protein